jgi:hypothetical protein
VTILLCTPLTAAGQIELDDEDLKVLTDAVAELRTSELSDDALAAAEAREQRIAEVSASIMELGAHALVPVARKMEQTSPDAWRTMVKRQYAKGFERVIKPAGLFLFAWVLWGLMRPFRRRMGMAGEQDKMMAGIRTVVGAFVGYLIPILILFNFLGRFLTALSEGAGYVINPEYYALQDLLITVLTKGAGG